MDLQRKIDAIFNPRSVAIIGASNKVGKWGFSFLRHLIYGGFRGAIFPVNPAGGQFQGLKVYPSLEEVPGPVDLAFIVVPPAHVTAAVTACGRKGISACVVITAGFQELGAEGKRLQEQMQEAANEAGIALVGPNCAGVTSPHPTGLYCMMQPNFPKPGHVAIVSQSGNVAGSLQYLLDREDVGVSRVVSVGNQAVLKAEDFFDYLISDRQTKVVVAYLEGIADGRRFMRAARALTRVKPLILIKGGRTDTGFQAARSHTGAIAGSHRIFKGACRQCGIMLVDDLEEVVDIAAGLLSQPLPAGDRVGIVANGGGFGVVIADACIEAGLTVVELPRETLEVLDRLLPTWWNRQNPVDMVAGTSRGAFFKAIDEMAKCPVVDSVIAQGFGYAPAVCRPLKAIPEEEHPGISTYIKQALYSDTRGMNFLLDVVQRHGKPLFLCSEFIRGAERDQNQAVLELRRRNLPFFPSWHRPVQALARLVAYRRYLAHQTG